MKPLIGLVLFLILASQADARCRLFRRRCVPPAPAIVVVEEPIVKLKDVYAEVARRADTPNQKINASEVSRVLASFFSVLNDFSPTQVSQIIADGLKRADQRDSKPKR